MRKPTRWLSCIAAAIVVLFLANLAVASIMARAGMDKDKTEYLLKGVDVDDDATYLIVRWTVENGKTRYAVCDDTKSIKENKENFIIVNSKSVYETAERRGTFTLYKNGKFQCFIWYHDEFTKAVHYGTLVFTSVNQLQYDVVMGDTIYRQENNYTIIESQKGADETQQAKFRVYAHGSDVQSVDAVFLLVCELQAPEQWHAPVVRSEQIIEFTHDFTYEEQAVTRYYYFDTAALALSEPFNHVIWLGNGNIIYFDGGSDGKGALVIQDAFDPAVYYTSIDLTDNQKSLTFLISATMLSDKELYITYYKESGGVARVLYLIEPRSDVVEV